MSHMRRALGSVLLGLVLAACGGAGGAPAGSGVQGIAVVGPSCPVERINSPCPPRPIAATIVVRNHQGAEVTRVESGSDGRFRVDLLPGSYTLIGITPGNGMLPRPIPTTVTVSQGTYASVTVEFDSGIR